MKLAYLVQWDLQQEDGVNKKLAAQTRAWQAAGHDVRLFALAPTSAVWAGLAALPCTITPAGPFWRRFAAARAAVAGVLAWQPELVYLRFGTWYPAYDTLCRALPVVLEINTDDVSQYRRQLPLPMFLYHRLSRGRLLRAAAGIVAVSGELAARLAWTGRPMLVVANGIDLAAYPQLPAPANERPRLFFIGSPHCPWHGVGEIAALAQAQPDWDFEIVGLAPGEWPAQTPNVRLHGQLPAAQYERLMAQADVALGSMAWYANGMAEACPLKVREYLACGLPVIVGYQDTDFPDGSPFLLSVPNRPGALLAARDQVAAFIATWRGRRVPRTAVQCLASEAKEARRLDFFATLLHRGHPAPAGRAS